LVLACLPLFLIACVVTWWFFLVLGIGLSLAIGALKHLLDGGR
jgi:hypothetical protein